jgi:hypothetical protein
VRQALAALIDRHALADASSGAVLPLFSVLPNGVQWSTGSAQEDDGAAPARAEELLRGADVTTPVSVRIARPVGPADVLCDELLRQLQVGGLFRVVASDTSEATARVLTEVPASPDPLTYLSLANGIDESAALADLIARARSDTDLASREQSVIDAQQQLADRSLAVPLWQGTTAVLVRSGVKRVSVSPYLRLWLLRPPA